MDRFLYVTPMIILFIIYYKVFRIASDVKEIREMLKISIKTEANKTLLGQRPEQQ